MHPTVPETFKPMLFALWMQKFGIWSNHSDLTRPIYLQMVVNSKENGTHAISGKPRLVKCYNLARWLVALGNESRLGLGPKSTSLSGVFTVGGLSGRDIHKEA